MGLSVTKEEKSTVGVVATERLMVNAKGKAVPDGHPDAVAVLAVEGKTVLEPGKVGVTDKGKAKIRLPKGVSAPSSKPEVPPYPGYSADGKPFEMEDEPEPEPEPETETETGE